MRDVGDSRALDDEAAPGREPGRPGFTRRKGHLEPPVLAALLILGGLPLLLALARILAMPGADALPLSGGGLLGDLGSSLNQWVSLQWVPPADRHHIVYLLLLPLGALIVVLARLTFGLRVLGLRAILISIGFQEAGFLPSFILMAIVIATILAIRPSLRRIQLPLFARITVILCLAALIMVGALLIAPWVRSEAVWGVAFFPVIIVAMLAESIAKTVANDNPVTAAWRTGWTLVAAVIIALIGQSQFIAEVAIRFPELMVSQIVAIILVSEFLDLRLLEHWPDRLHRRLQGIQEWRVERPRVAVVRNRWNAGVIVRLDRPAPRKYQRRSVQRVVDCLRDLGYVAEVFEGDMDLLRELKGFLAPDPRTGRMRGMVLNLASGIQGNGRFSQVPAMLEMAGVPYTGPDPIAQGRLADRYALMSLLRQANVPVPRFAVVYDSAQVPDPPFPVTARPRYEPDGPRSTAADAAGLQEAVERVGRRYGQEVVIEEVVAGRDIRVCLLGNGDIECFPVLELAGEQRVCPAPLDGVLADRVRAYALAAFRAAGCRDYARVDFRIAPDGQVWVVDVRWADLLKRGGAYAEAAAAAGYDYTTLIGRIIGVAAARYEAPAVMGSRPAPAASSAVVSLADRKLAARRGQRANGGKGGEG